MKCLVFYNSDTKRITTTTPQVRIKCTRTGGAGELRSPIFVQVAQPPVFKDGFYMLQLMLLTGIASPETRPPVIWTGKIWKLRFWTGSYLSWTGPPDGPSHNHPCRFFVRACPSMPFYNVIETAKKSVTDNVSITTVYYLRQWHSLCITESVCLLVAS